MVSKKLDRTSPVHRNLCLLRGFKAPFLTLSARLAADKGLFEAAFMLQNKDSLFMVCKTGGVYVPNP